MAETKCPGCGAAGGGAICRFCGKLLDPSADPVVQKRALDELHQAITIELLQTAFLPDDRAVLIEAGLRCIPLFNAHESSQDKLGPAAIRRLRAIVAKLRITAHDDARRAADEFEREINRYKRASAFNIIMGLGIIFLVIYGAWWLLRKK